MVAILDHGPYGVLAYGLIYVCNYLSYQRARCVHVFICLCGFIIDDDLSTRFNRSMGFYTLMMI